MDNRLAQQTIESLKAEMQQLKGGTPTAAEDNTARSAAEIVANRLQNSDELRQQLVEMMMERDQLVRALQQEQSNHIETRKNLTIALGDAIDRLAKEQAGRGKSDAATGETSQIETSQNEGTN